ncbi:MAG: SDR family oxidoreductase [Pseudomonadota bacterium]
MRLEPHLVARYADLDGKRVFISGGATGIGRDLVAAFAGQGARATFVDLDEEAGEALAAATPGASFVSCDVTDDRALEAAIAAAAEEEALDVLVNNAANDARRPFETVDADSWRAAVDVNLRHQFVAIRAAAPAMKARRRGSIVNFGSVAPEMMIADLAVYSACKSAVRGLTRSLARDLGPYGVRVNAILPGAILTERQRALWYADQAAIDALVSRQCLKRELAGGDVAAMALFLASDASAACTAQDFIVDGGMV